jgi:hypothetical protein
MTWSRRRHVWLAFCLGCSIGLLPIRAIEANPAAAPPADDGRPAVQPSGDAGPGPSGSGNPGQRLDRSGGVIAPPRDVDPGMQIKPPPDGSMPVIPPPGTPGGDPNVRPK